MFILSYLIHGHVLMPINIYNHLKVSLKLKKWLDTKQYIKVYNSEQNLNIQSRL